MRNKQQPSIRHLDAADRLRRAGLRVTGPRVAILTELDTNRTHPGAEDIHARLVANYPSISVSTVYLTLQALARAGLVRRLPDPSGRLRVDGTLSDHDHATCRHCGAVFDVPRAPPSGLPLPVRLPHGLTLLDARVEYEVLCWRCRRRSRSGAAVGAAPGNVSAGSGCSFNRQTRRE